MLTEALIIAFFVIGLQLMVPIVLVALGEAIVEDRGTGADFDDTAALEQAYDADTNDLKEVSHLVAGEARHRDKLGVAVGAGLIHPIEH